MKVQNQQLVFTTLSIDLFSDKNENYFAFSICFESEWGCCTYVFAAIEKGG